MNKTAEKIRKSAETALAVAASIGAVALPSSVVAPAAANAAPSGRTAKAESGPAAKFRHMKNELAKTLNNREEMAAVFDGTLIRQTKNPSGGEGLPYVFLITAEPASGLSEADLSNPRKVHFGIWHHEKGFEPTIKDIGGLREGDMLLPNRPQNDGSASVLGLYLPDVRGLGELPNNGSHPYVSYDMTTEHAFPMRDESGHLVKVANLNKPVIGSELRQLTGSNIV